MKKFFTTILMMGVALAGWASVTAEVKGGPGPENEYLEINYIDEGNNELQNLNLDQLLNEPRKKDKGTVKFTGDWANKDMQKIGDIVGKMTKNVVIDFSACTKMVSKVKYTGEGDVDWVSTNFVYLPNANYPEQVTVTGTATVSSKFYESWGAEYTGDGSLLEQHADGLWYEPNTNWNPKTKKDVFVNENGVVLSEDQVTPNGDGTYSYSYTYTIDPTAISFDSFNNNRNKVKGIVFPNHENFTAIPDELCLGEKFTNLEDVTFGDNLVWIGKSAFKECVKLNDVTFPQTLKVIGVDAFYGCTNFTTVDLRIRDLVKVDAAAFNMKQDYPDENTAPADYTGTYSNKLTTVYLPGSVDEPNETFKFFGNQVFSSSLIEELDFRGCLGIEHFAYDGEAFFGESGSGGNHGVNRTFTWHRFLKRVYLPKKLRHLAEEAFYKCMSLQELYFTGEADYDKGNCPEVNKLNNPLTIGKGACCDTPLEVLKLSNNVTEIGEVAFARTALTEVVIPASVETIKKQAFMSFEGNGKKLKTVRFEDIDEGCAPCQHAKTHIENEAFLHNTGITDVYIETEVEITCANEGFDRNVTFAQGNAEAATNGQAATLHYPAGHEDHYVNLRHPLTDEEASDPGKFQKWLVDHMAAAINAPTGYGWYEFVNSGSKSKDDPEYDPDPENPERLPLILRTFSDPEYARIVPDGLRAYVVNSVTKDAANNNYVLTLQRLSVIPAQTGVILFGQPNSKATDGNYTLSLTAVTYAEGDGLPLRRDYWDLLGKADKSQAFKNYLQPIIATAKIRTPAVEGTYNPASDTFVTKDQTTVYPYEPYKKAPDYVPGSKVAWRNFALNRMSETANLQSKFSFDLTEDNFAGFFRIIAGTYPSGLAYLHLSVDEYDAAQGAECVVTPDADYATEYNKSGPYYPQGNSAYKWWNNGNTWENMIDGWGTRKPKFNEPNAVQYLGEFEDTDGIVQMVIPENKMGEVFSITGMKVNNPSNGIYIVNGKKVIIK